MKFIITEEEKKYIRRLYYEGVIPEECSPEEKEKYDNLVNNIYSEQLKIAIKWWEDWLSNEVTKQKFIQNNPQEKNPKGVFENYFKILKEIQIEPYGGCASDKTMNYFLAYVKKGENKIYMNTIFDLDNQIISDTLIHEIQHVLYNYYPLNPNLKIDDCFTNKTYKRGLVFQKLKNIFNKNKDQSNNVINVISKDLEIPIESAKKLYDAIISVNKTWAEYVSHYSEVSSRIYTVRRMLNIKPNDNITKDMLKPYFKYIIDSEDPIQYLKDGSSKYFDINLLILYWGYTGFKNIDNLLNGLNQLAFKQNTDNSNFV